MVAAVLSKVEIKLLTNRPTHKNEKKNNVQYLSLSTFYGKLNSYSIKTHSKLSL